MDAVELKQKKKGGKDKSALSKQGQSTGLLSHVNENVNMFSQLSAMFLANKADNSDQVKKFLEKTEDKQVFQQHSYGPEIQQCLNQMNKKSQITKLKALSTLKELLQKQNEEFFEQFISTWTYLYKQFVNSEYDRKVFEESNNVLIIIISKNRKCLQAQFKELFPYWFIQMNDPSPDVSQIANQAFDKMFPIEKQTQAFNVCMEKYILNLKYYLSITQKQIESENNNLNEHESLEVYDRLVVSSLNSIARAIQLNKDSKDPNIFINLLEEELFTQGKKSILIELLSKKRIKVRAAVIEVLQVLMNTISQEVLEQNIETIAKNIMPLIDDKERQIQYSLWKGCLLTVLDKAAAAIIAKCDLKMIEIKSLEVLKKAASGIGKQFYQNTIIFLSKLPMAAFTSILNKENVQQYNKFNAEEYIKERFSFIKKFFESILAGFGHDEIKFFGDQLVQSYFECIYFIVLKRISVVLDKEKVKPLKNVQKQARNLIRDLICNILNIYLEQNIADNVMNPYKQIPNSLGQLLNNFNNGSINSNETDLFDEFIFEFQSIFSKTAKKDPTKYNNYILLLQSIANLVNKDSVLFNKLDSAVQKMHEDLLNDLKGQIQPLMNDSHIEKILPICTQYKLYANLFNYSQQKQQKKQELESEEEQKQSQIQLGIFSNLIAQQTLASLETINFSVQSIIQNIKTITNPTSLEKFTTFVSQIYYSWSESLDEQHPQNNSFQQILKDIQNHIKMLNQVDPKALLHLQFILHFALPETTSTYFSQFCTHVNKIKPIDDVLILRNLNALESAQSQKNRVHMCTRLQNNQEYQTLAFGILSHIFGKMDRYLGVSLPLLVIIFKNYLNKDNKIKLISQIQTNISKKREQIFNGEIQEKNTSRVIDELELNYLFCIQIYKNLPKVIDQNFDHLQFFNDFFKFIYFCFEKKLKSRIQQAFKIFKYLINDQLALTRIIENATVIFKNELNTIFIEKKQAKFDILIKLIVDTFSFLKSHKKKDEILQLTSIILEPKYFENIIFEQRNWKLLEALFEQISVSIDFNAYFKKIFVSQDGLWLISNLISSQQIFAILNSIQLKKYFKDLANNFIKPLIHNQIEEEFGAVLQFLNYMMKLAIEKSLIYGNSLKACLKQIMADGIETHKQQQIFNDIVKVKLDQLFGLENIDLMVREGILIKNLLPLFQEQLEKDSGSIEDLLRKRVSEVCRINAQELTDNRKLSSLISLDILMASFYNDFYTTEGQQIQLTEFMLNNFEKFDSYNNYQNYYTSVFFTFINVVLEKIGIEPFSANLIAIENHFRKAIEYNAKPRKLSSNALISLLVFLRKIVNIIEGGFSSDFKEFVIQNIMDTCLIKLTEFEQDQSQSNNIGSNLIIDESNDIVIIEFAETISRFVTILNEYFDENLSYELLNCRYPSIQKSSFILLKQFYQAFSPKVDLALKCQTSDEDFEDKLLQNIYDQKMNVENLLKYLDVTNVILTEEEKQKHIAQIKKQQGILSDDEGEQQKEEKKTNQDSNSTNTQSEETDNINYSNPFEEREGKDADEEDEDESENQDIIDPKTYGHLLTWISFVNKLNSPETNENHELVKKALKIYLDENKFIYKNFLTVLFQWIEFLEIPESQYKDTLSIEEVQNVNPEWSDFLSRESLFQLLVQSLYIFSSKFPFFLRNWLENTAEKRFIKVAESLIKSFISNALYLKEVETIELSQIEWQSEEFNIYVLKKTREINAVYMKENQKLEINLKIPLEYPIKHIQTEVKRGMKVNQQKTNKWMLMMKSLLFNQNNTIKNALLMWKDNLDKELEGLEECAICYYVINSTSGELPKLPCKTCKKKFHSSCIHKWFKSSNKSECPLCKSQFL
ncbi:hypothetical protein ABPG72_000862 [Tetrahymena utriculariae]